MNDDTWYSCDVCPFGTENFVDAVAHERATEHAITVNRLRQERESDS